MAAPPTIEKQRKPEVASSEAVERSSVIVKMTGNMIELNRPMAMQTKPALTPPMAKA